MLVTGAAPPVRECPAASWRCSSCYSQADPRAYASRWAHQRRSEKSFAEIPAPHAKNSSDNKHLDQSACFAGGLWMSQEQCGESSKPSNSQSGSPQGPLHLPGSSRGTSSLEAIAWKTKTMKDQRAAITCPGKMMYRLVHHELFADTEKVMIPGTWEDF
ncbi:UNVERIFIED_CONTAM: hypothetical protein Sangu_1064900 [Sesamum angustifolium]|uniref:Uncharacterized protein n=1 Tax=Sesamum angustifolium TaxID=2727405 RepID=A0AAW2P131_9LAMI